MSRPVLRTERLRLVPLDERHLDYLGRRTRAGARPGRDRALLEHAFATVGLQRVWAGTMVVNTASRGVLEEVGPRHVSTYVGHWEDPIPGWKAGEVVCELTRTAWEARA